MTTKLHDVGAGSYTVQVWSKSLTPAVMSYVGPSRLLKKSVLHDFWQARMPAPLNCLNDWRSSGAGILACFRLFQQPARKLVKAPEGTWRNRK